jgi:hypothetical protein
MSYTDAYNQFKDESIDYYTYIDMLYNVIKNENKFSANDNIKEAALREAIKIGPEELPQDQKINKNMQDMYDNNESAEDILGYAINNNYGEGYYINNGYHIGGGSRRNKPTPKSKAKPKAKPKHEDMTMKDIKEMCKANLINLSKVVEGKRVVYKKKELITKLKRKKLL